MTRARRKFTDEFKLQMVQLVHNGKTQGEICREYDLTSSALSTWIKNYNNSKSFKYQDNLTDSEKEITRLKKELKQKNMEVDILKQAALLIGKR